MYIHTLYITIYIRYTYMHANLYISSNLFCNHLSHSIVSLSSSIYATLHFFPPTSSLSMSI